MNTDNFTPEQLEKARELASSELARFAETEGIALTEEQLELVNGGETKWFDSEFDIIVRCPKCGKDITFNLNFGRPKFCPYCRDNWEAHEWETKNRYPTGIIMTAK